MPKKTLNSIVTLLIIIYSSFVQSDIETIKQRGHLICGVAGNYFGFSSYTNGQWQGFDIDFCRSVATAIFNDDQKVKFIPLFSTERFEAVIDQEVDLLVRVTTWTMSRDTEYGNFIGINYYDGQAFMVPHSTGIDDIEELDGAVICVNKGSTSELNLKDYFQSNNLQHTVLSFANPEDAKNSYENGKCDAITSDLSLLASMRVGIQRPMDHHIITQLISKEPHGPMVAHNQPILEDIARWSLNCMINAEEFGISSENVNQFNDSKDFRVANLLGEQKDFGSGLGIDAKWCFNIISRVGNYGESFERNLGILTPVGIRRSINSLWIDGGIIYAPPIR